MRSSRTDAVERAATWYRKHCSWHVDVVDGAVLLLLGHGIVALDVPVDRATRVQKTLELYDVRTPALLIAKPEPSVVFLAEADEAVLGQHQMPADVRFLMVLRALRLPLLHAEPTDGTKWLWPPDPVRRWLPSVSAVLAAVNAATPFALRAPTRARRASRERILIG